MSDADAGGRPAVFLDRDGTVVVDKHHLSDPQDVELIPRAADALRRLGDLGLALVVVTNQSGIARGLFTTRDYRSVAAELDRRLARAGLAFDATYFCPDPPWADPRSTCRKPGLAMYRRAAADLGIDPSRSYCVGDKRSDVEPARRLGGTGVLVRTGRRPAREPAPGEGLHAVDDLWAAARLIERLERERAPKSASGAA